MKKTKSMYGKTQKDKIKNFLLCDKTITASLAEKYWKVANLPAVIYTLKKEGLAIESKMKKTKKGKRKVYCMSDV